MLTNRASAACMFGLFFDGLGAGAVGRAANAVANCLHFWDLSIRCARAPVAREWPPRKVCTGVPQTRKLLDFRWSRGREAKRKVIWSR